MDQKQPQEDHAQEEVGQPLTPSAAPTPQEHETKPARHESRSTGSDGTTHKRAPLRWHDVMGLCFTGIVAIATAFYTWVSHGQLAVMQETLKQMKGSDAATAQIVEANKSLAETAKDALAENRRLNRFAAETVAHTKRQTEIAARNAEVAAQSVEVAAQSASELKAEAEANRKVAEEQLGLQRQELRRGERAQIVVVGFGLLEPADYAALTLVKIRNVGTTTARVTVGVTLVLETTGLPNLLDARTTSPPYKFSAAAIQNVTRTIAVKEEADFPVRVLIDPEVIKEWKAWEGKTLFLVGSARSTDQTGQIQQVRICAIIDKTVTRIRLQPKHKIVNCPDNNTPEEVTKQ
jgi:hypothetical protein